MAGKALVLIKYGYGYGDGDGYGYGNGYGDGYGYGYGDGNGNGDGYGYLSAVLAGYLDHPTVAELVAAGLDVSLAWWRSDAAGRSANGGRMAEAARPGLDQEVAGPLRLCSARALHASASPQKWEGDRWWAVALVGEVAHEADKAGALRRVILGEPIA